MIVSRFYNVILVGACCMIMQQVQPRTVTVFYQGMNNTQVQAARLVGKDGFVYRYTGEKVWCLNAIDCIINLVVYPEIAEVELFNKNASWFHYALRPMTLSWFLANRVSHWYNTMQIEPLDDEQNTSENSIWTHAIRIRAINLGQDGDITEHAQRVALCRTENPDDALVLYGVSRGSLTTFNAYAQYQYEGVKAVVLEGCPSSIPDVLRTSYGSIIHALYREYIQYFCAHDPDGISALSCVEQFPHETPVLFITSEKDRVVPASCTLHLVDLLVKTGHPHVYCLVLKNSSHIGYSFDDPDDAHNYQSVVHAFYKKHGISGYNELYAAAGQDLLEQCHRSL